MLIHRRGRLLLPVICASVWILFVTGCRDDQNSRSEKSTATAPPSNSQIDRPSGITLVAAVRESNERTQEVSNGPREQKRFEVILRDVVRLPPSSKEKPLARINYLYHANDASGRVFVADARGGIYIIKNEQLLPEPFLDMKIREPAFTMAPSEGLSTFAFHPDFAKAGRPGYGKFYTTSTEVPSSGTSDYPPPARLAKPQHHGVLTEWTVDAKNPNRIDPKTRREVLRIAHPAEGHIMGQIAFNPNARPGEPDYGMLYIGMGDGSNAPQSLRNAQDKSLPFGKILRINPLPSAASKYSVPSDNPFIRDASAMKEVWAYGLRNPQRFSWDTGGDQKMIIADIGERQAEELNVGKAGANYGWGEREGTFAVNPNDESKVTALPPDDAKRGYTYPALQYRRVTQMAITGGYVYRGYVAPDLRGKYVFGDIVTGKIYFTEASELVNDRPAPPFYELPLKYSGRQQSLLEILGGDSRADLRFGMDERGEIYVTTKRDGAVRKLSISSQLEGTLRAVPVSNVP